MERAGRESVQSQDDEAAEQPTPDRQWVADQIRRHATELARSDMQALGYWLRPEDVGPDQLSEYAAAGLRRLATDLAFAVEMDAPTLVADEVAWLVRLLHHRGYDAAHIVPATLDIFEAALAAVCPAEVLTGTRPLLVACRQAVPQTLAALAAEPNR